LLLANKRFVANVGQCSLATITQCSFNDKVMPFVLLQNLLSNHMDHVSYLLLCQCDTKLIVQNSVLKPIVLSANLNARFHKIYVVW
jgi:hypothetical protein